MAIITNCTNYWKCDENTGTTTSDIVGGLTGTLTGSTLPTWNTTGKFNNSLTFSNATQMYIATTKVIPTDIFTINYWFANTDTGGPACAGTVNSSSYSKQGWRFHCSQTDVSAYLFFNNGAGGCYTGYTPSPSLDSGWHMFTFVYISGGTSRLYVDGIERATQLNSGASNFAQTAWHFGSAYIVDTVPAGRFTGKVDEVGIWSTALSPSDISGLYNSGNGLAYPFLQYSSIAGLSSLTGVSSITF